MCSALSEVKWSWTNVFIDLPLFRSRFFLFLASLSRSPLFHLCSVGDSFFLLGCTYVYIYICMLFELTRDLLLRSPRIAKIVQDNRTRYDLRVVPYRKISKISVERSSFLFKSILGPASFFPFVEGASRCRLKSNCGHLDSVFSLAIQLSILLIDSSLSGRLKDFAEIQRKGLLESLPRHVSGL